MTPRSCGSSGVPSAACKPRAEHPRTIRSTRSGLFARQLHPLVPLRHFPRDRRRSCIRDLLRSFRLHTRMRVSQLPIAAVCDGVDRFQAFADLLFSAGTLGPAGRRAVTASTRARAGDVAQALSPSAPSVLSAKRSPRAPSRCNRARHDFSRSRFTARPRPVAILGVHAPHLVQQRAARLNRLRRS